MEQTSIKSALPKELYYVGFSSMLEKSGNSVHVHHGWMLFWNSFQSGFFPTGIVSSSDFFLLTQFDIQSCFFTFAGPLKLAGWWRGFPLGFVVSLLRARFLSLSVNQDVSGLVQLESWIDQFLGIVINQLDATSRNSSNSYCNHNFANILYLIPDLVN